MADSIEGIVRILKKGITKNNIPYTKIEIDEGQSGKKIIFCPMSLDLLIQGQKVRYSIKDSGFMDGKEQYTLKVTEGLYKDLEYDSGYIPWFDQDKVDCKY